MLKTKLDPLAVSQICFKSNSVGIDAIQPHINPARRLVDVEQVAPGYCAIWWYGTKHSNRARILCQRNERFWGGRRDKHSEVLLGFANPDVKGTPWPVVSFATISVSDYKPSIDTARVDYKYWLAGITRGPGASSETEFATSANAQIIAVGRIFGDFKSQLIFTACINTILGREGKRVIPFASV